MAKKKKQNKETRRLLKRYHEERTALDSKIDAQLREIESILGINIEEA